MKTFISFAIFLALLPASLQVAAAGNEQKKSSPASEQTTLYISPGLAELGHALAQHYAATGHGIPLCVEILPSDDEARSGSSTASALYLLNGDDEGSPAGKGFMRFVAGREIIVAVAGLHSSLIAANTGGVSRQKMAGMLQSGEFHALVLNDPLTAKISGEWLSPGMSSAPAMKSMDRDEFLSVIKSDPKAVGFCRLTDILAAGGNTFTDGIQLIPVDKNANGKLDYMERIYDTPQEFLRGVWIGKYPAQLTKNIILGTTAAEPSVAGFITWVLTGGQARLAALGYSELAPAERRAQLDRFAPEPVVVSEITTAGNWRVVITILALLMLAGIVTGLVVRRFREGNRESALLRQEIPALGANDLSIPGGILFDRTHTWSFMEKEGMVRVGVDDFIPHLTGTITRVILRNPGEMVRKGEYLCTVAHEGKALKIHAPATGTIAAVNERLLRHPELINLEPYAGGWLYLVEPMNWERESSFQQVAGHYREWIGKEILRLKDFLATTLSRGDGLAMQAVMQDGGEVKDHALADLGPGVWVEFQEKFMDVSR